MVIIRILLGLFLTTVLLYGLYCMVKNIVLAVKAKNYQWLINSVIVLALGTAILYFSNAFSLFDVFYLLKEFAEKYL